jgi:hypothetical protein
MKCPSCGAEGFHGRRLQGKRKSWTTYNLVCPQGCRGRQIAIELGLRTWPESVTPAQMREALEGAGLIKAAG